MPSFRGGADMLTVRLPWPPAELSPNARAHHFAKARKVKAYRTGAGWEALQAFNAAGRPRMTGPVAVSVTFHQPDNRRRDLDNMLASIKAGLDGIAETVGVDDSRFSITIAKGGAVHLGAVVVKLTPALADIPHKGTIE